ncbi:MAG: LysR family transcriptional regulator [Pseudomonadales bacterium]|jgi:DNA-binding transcriptional LysR family regulator|nr:LysR family transcriptional regulator [Pseudomonadales bacterium]
MRFTLRQLEVFLATARLENLSRAAQTLSLSQSAASDSLRELEHQFDLQLFDRVGKRLQLNDNGRLVLAQAEALLSRAQELEDTLRQHQGIGALKVGATLSIGNALCIPLIQQYRQHYPDSPISLEIANTERISQMVAGFELDVGMIEGEINNPALDIRRWREDHLQIFCAPTHPLAAKAELSDDDLRGHGWILRETGSGTRQTFDRVMHDLLPYLHLELELQHNEAIIQAVAAGMGLGCLSTLSLTPHLVRGNLVILTAPRREFRRSLYLITHRQKYRSAALGHWLALCQGLAS